MCSINVFHNYQTNTTAYVFKHSFICYIREIFRPTVSAIIGRYYRNIKCKTDNTKEEASPLQYYSDLK